MFTIVGKKNNICNNQSELRSNTNAVLIELQFSLINEMLYSDVIGNDLRESLFLMMERLKEELAIPEVMKFAKIADIYKGETNNIQNKTYGIIILTSLYFNKTKLQKF